MTDLAAGVALAAGAAACFEGAYILQALEARRAPSAALRQLLRRPRWVLGAALALGGAALQVGALRLAPITAVQPTLALGVVVLVLAGSRVFGERLTAADLAAAAAIAGGVALLAIAGDDVTAERIRTVPAAVALVLLAVPLVVAQRRASGPWLVAGASAGDALAALVAARFAAELSPLRAVIVLWFAAGVIVVLASVRAEMSAVRIWPVTRVGPLVLGGQTALPVLLAPIVVGQDWTGRAPLVLAGLALTLAGAARLAASAGSLREAVDGPSGGQLRETVEEDVGGGGQREP